MKKLILKLIRWYQQAKIFRDKACRFRPTCSQYSYQAIEKYGILKGTWIGVKRIVRCHPWGKEGYDPLK